MGKTRLIISCLLVHLAGVTPALAADAGTYTIQVGDTLSQVAKKAFGLPIYSEGGSLSKILALNPEVSDPNRVMPGQVIRIDGTIEPERAPAHVKTSDEGTPAADRTPNAEPSAPNEVLTSTVPVSSNTETYPSSALELAPEFRFVKMTATDLSTGAQAILVSDSHVGLRGAWVQRWTPSTSSYQYLSYARTSFAAPATKTLETTSFTSIGFGFGMRFFQDRAHRIRASVGAEQSPYIRATSATSVRFDPIVTPVARVQSEHDLMRIDPFRAGIGLLGESRAPGSNDRVRAKWGYALGASAYLEQNFAASQLRATGSYLHGQQDSSIAKQTRNEIGFELNYSFSLGGGASAAPAQSASPSR